MKRAAAALCALSVSLAGVSARAETPPRLGAGFGPTESARLAPALTLPQFAGVGATVLPAQSDGLIEAFAPWGMHHGGCGEWWGVERVVILRRGACEAGWIDTLTHELCHGQRWQEAGDDGHGIEWATCYAEALAALGAEAVAR